MHSLTPRFLEDLRLNAADGTALKALGESRGRQELFRRQTPELLSALKEAAVIESSESSNRIEGVIAPHERVEALVLRNAVPRDRSEQEIAGYRDALNMIHESWRDMAFTVNVMLQLHSMLYRYHAGAGGRWKTTQNEIVEKDSDGRIHRVRFTPTGPAETPSMMAGLEERYRGAVADGHEALLIVPLAVLDVLCIHPFSDGNGRVARLVTLMLLYQAGYEAGRYVSLERIIEESKETYYEALEASSKHWHQGKHDPFPWLRYFWGVVLRAYREFEERVGTLREGRGSKTDLVRAAIGRRIGGFAISDIEADCPGVTRDWIRIVMRRMKAEGLIEPHGRGRGAKWTRRDN